MQTKICSKCKIEKNMKHQGYCKECRIEYQRQYRIENKDKIKLYSIENKDKIKQYYNKDKIKQYYKQYYNENKDKIKQSKKQYYEENKDKIKQYYDQNKDKIKQYNKQYYDQNKDKIKKYCIDSKICKKCGIAKSVNDFSHDKSKPDGLRYCCKLCNNYFRRIKYNMQKVQLHKCTMFNNKLKGVN